VVQRGVGLRLGVNRAGGVARDEALDDLAITARSTRRGYAHMARIAG
jgi:hypothetical protein